jgi:hypothetical protein
LNLYLHGYCPKDVAEGLLQKIAVNWPNMLDDIPRERVPIPTPAAPPVPDPRIDAVGRIMTEVAQSAASGLIASPAETTKRILSALDSLKGTK